jgi:hypothetical protein
MQQHDQDNGDAAQGVDVKISRFQNPLLSGPSVSASRQKMPNLWGEQVCTFYRIGHATAMPVLAQKPASLEDAGQRFQLA